MTVRQLTPGDPVPWFVAPSTSNPRYHFESVAGRYILLCFFGSAATPAMAEMLAAFGRRGDLFDDDHAAFFGVSCDPADQRDKRVAERIPGYRYFWDFELKVSVAYGVSEAPEPGRRVTYRPTSFILDPNLHVLAVLPIADPLAHAREVAEFVAALPRRPAWNPPRLTAPVLVVPRVFEPALCRDLIAFYDRVGGKDSGYMTSDEAGRTVGVIDYGRKRRRDCQIEDVALQTEVRRRIERRLIPELRKAFQFGATRIERYIIACYDAGEGGYFRAHRDNTTKGTAHRQFAVTINLNAEDYDGGDLCFPEYDRITYRAPTGGAVVFSCSLMHEALPVTRGRRYCVLPFLYDETGARIRAENAAALAAKPDAGKAAGSTGGPAS